MWCVFKYSQARPVNEKELKNYIFIHLTRNVLIIRIKMVFYLSIDVLVFIKKM